MPNKVGIISIRIRSACTSSALYVAARIRWAVSCRDRRAGCVASGPWDGRCRLDIQTNPVRYASPLREFGNGSDNPHILIKY